MSAAHSHEWHIRLARAADAPHLPAIERAAGTMFARIDGLHDLPSHPALPVETLARYIARGHSLVACQLDRVVGFLVSEPFGRELHVREVDVHPDAQGKGIGAALLRGCMIDAGNSGFDALTLTTFADVPWNAPFYRRIGFVDIAPADHARLAGELEKEEAQGMPPGSRVAMIRHFA
ncbi:MAG: GNAT family N-acetyltransferase [Erythrobacter sp.]|nr:GNAT family N-acetyltransferase [Erythrobacter sp.]NCQ64822.1 GNAT family N-acetyltransferase [Alphaproteobacteria bacterium]